MSARNISSLILVDAGGVPSGIVHRPGPARQGGGRRPDGSEGVGGIMSPLRFTIDARRLAFEALLMMIRHDVHHLVVLEGGGSRASSRTTT